MKKVNGFSKLSKEQKINWVAEQLSAEKANQFKNIKTFWHQDKKLQKTIDEFSENTISNFIFPYGLSPNFFIDGKDYCVPMVIEESSVVAAASKSAKFWATRGGFKTKVINNLKSGQVHFNYIGPKEFLFNFFKDYQEVILNSSQAIVSNMEKRGGGITSIELVDKTSVIENYFQLDCKFKTCNAMGANFINSVLEKFAETLQINLEREIEKNNIEAQVEIIMSILSNYTPECLVTAYVECPLEDLGVGDNFAFKFKRAVDIAINDVSRAVTHNKGIFNGIDAVVLATGNDFRSIEACGHAYAARSGQYRSLSTCTIKDGIFKFEMTLPLALGTVGGLTSLHPLAKTSLELLGDPSAEELMRIIACVGLAQNFGAIKSLVTTGIQKGHMKMHLLNVLNQLEASDKEISNAKEYFKKNIVSFSKVREFLLNSRM